MSGLEFVFVALAAVAAGVVNSLAGGGTLITFPALLACGVPSVAANITNTVALCPGYLGATLAQAGDLRGQRRRMYFLLPAAAVGGVGGGALLLVSQERVFNALVPALLLLSSGLLALQGPVRAWLVRRNGGATTGHSEGWTALPIALAAVYGGYFGAGLSVVVLGVLGLFLHDTLTRLNALKQSVALSANVAAAVFFLFSGQVLWTTALVMAGGALVGGLVGGRLAGRIRPSLLRWLVVTMGLVVAGVYLVRLLM